MIAEPITIPLSMFIATLAVVCLLGGIAGWLIPDWKD